MRLLWNVTAGSAAYFRTVNKGLINKLLHRIFLGNNASIGNYSEYRRIVLAGQYALLSLAVIVFYLTLEIINSGVLFSQINVVFASTFTLISASLYLQRTGKYKVGNVLLFSTVNIVLFLTVSSESNETYAYLFFIPTALGSFCIFNYEQRLIALFFAMTSFALAFLCIIDDHSLMEFRNYSKESIRLNQIVNFAVAFPVSIMAIYMLINVNHDNAELLTETNQQLEKLNKELDRFVYSTSHDLRAPLLSVLGLLQLADRDNSHPEVRKYHKMMGTRLSTLDKFVKDITDYSRNNRIHVKNESVNIHALADDIWDTLKYGVTAEIKFINDLPEDMILQNDISRLRVVLSNLIANAIRYHDHRKADKFIRVHHELRKGVISIHVQDNGQGIAEEFQSRIFDMFFRANENSSGSGLGLYIVKETLAKLSATIHLTSVPCVGSTFTVQLKTAALTAA